MSLRPFLAIALLSIGLAGCATFTEPELAQVRHSGVSPAVVGKFERSTELRPGEIIELTKRGVPENLIVRQIEDAGVDYVLTRYDVKRLRNARVSPAVLDALIAASQDFASRYAPGRRVAIYSGVYPGYGAYPYYDDDAYYYGLGYGVPVYGVGLGYYHGHYWGRHWH